MPVKQGRQVFILSSSISVGSFDDGIVGVWFIFVWIKLIKLLSPPLELTARDESIAVDFEQKSLGNFCACCLRVGSILPNK